MEIDRKLNAYVTLGATYWGLQQWSVGDAIYGDPSGQSVLAFSPYLQLPKLLGGLDDLLGYTYASEIQNAEFNAFFRLNAADPYWEFDWLWGRRYIYFAEHFNLSGADDLNGAAEQVDFRTANNLVGVQTGLLYRHGWSHFEWEAGLKVGLMANIYNQRGLDAASGPPGVMANFVPYDVSNKSSDYSALFEVSLAARYRLNDNLWLRLGYEFYGITGLALAPQQLGGFSRNGNVSFDGLSLGLQAAW